MKSKKRLGLAALVVLLSLMLSVACSRSKDDAQLSSEVQSKLQTDSNLQGRQIQVTSNGGVVTLNGTVSSDFERTAAANDAAQVSGIKTVVNNLQVQQAAAEPAAPAPAEPAPMPEPAPARHSAPSRRASAPPPPAPAPHQYNDSGYNSAAAAPADLPTPVRAVTIPEGSALDVRLIDALNSETSQNGDAFRASLAHALVVDGQTVVPANADVEGRVVDVKSAGHFKGQSSLTLQLTRLTVNGKSYDLSTNQWIKEGSSRGKRTAATVGGGGALGALIGGIAGGGKGAAIGAAVGAGAGTGVQAATKGQQIDLPSETVLNFSLQAPISVIPASSRNR